MNIHVLLTLRVRILFYSRHKKVYFTHFFIVLKLRRQSIRRSLPYLRLFFPTLPDPLPPFLHSHHTHTQSRCGDVGTVDHDDDDAIR